MASKQQLGLRISLLLLSLLVGKRSSAGDTKLAVNEEARRFPERSCLFVSLTLLYVPQQVDMLTSCHVGTLPLLLCCFFPGWYAQRCKQCVKREIRNVAVRK